MASDSLEVLIQSDWPSPASLSFYSLLFLVCFPPDSDTCKDLTTFQVLLHSTSIYLVDWTMVLLPWSLDSTVTWSGRPFLDSISKISPSHSVPWFIDLHLTYVSWLSSVSSHVWAPWEQGPLSSLWITTFPLLVLEGYLLYHEHPTNMCLIRPRNDLKIVTHQ